MEDVRKSKLVMKRSEFGYTAHANFIPFEYADIPSGMIVSTVVMARKDVDAMGWPEEITVTIEPGDTLNV